MEPAVTIKDAAKAVAATAIELVPPSEPPFLRENWKRALGCNREDVHKFVRVASGVANVIIASANTWSSYSHSSSPLLIRSALALPDGFYEISSGNELVRHDYVQGWTGYPDAEAARPNFKYMTPSPPIARDTIGVAVRFCDDVRRHEGGIVVDKTGLYMRQNNEFFFRFPFELPLSGEPFYLDPLYLKLALVEMLRYDSVCISMEHRPDRTTPLLIGIDWGHCALLMPRRGGH